MITDLQRRIELGQDINNTWELIAAESPKLGYHELVFKKLFPVVQKCNAWAREEKQRTEDGLQ